MEFYFIAGFCLVLLILLIVMYMKDRESEKKFARFEQVLEDNMQEFFIIKKEFIAIKKLIDDLNIGDFSEKIDEQVEMKIAPIVRSLQMIDSVVREKIGTNPQESLVISEFQQGKSIEQIAEEYSMSYQGVEFILKLNQII